MNSGHDNDASRETGAHGFDERLRHVHAQAVASVSPRTRLRLRPQRPAPAAAVRSRVHAWPLAATCAIALVAGGLFLRHPATTAPDGSAPTATTALTSNSEVEPGDVYATLDESPELYLWLASNDTENLVTE
jgi:hypothetical protein